MMFGSSMQSRRPRPRTERFAPYAIVGVVVVIVALLETLPRESGSPERAVTIDAAAIDDSAIDVASGSPPPSPPYDSCEDYIAMFRGLSSQAIPGAPEIIELAFDEPPLAGAALVSVEGRAELYDPDAHLDFVGAGIRFQSEEYTAATITKLAEVLNPYAATHGEVWVRAEKGTPLALIEQAHAAAPRLRFMFVVRWPDWQMAEAILEWFPRTPPYVRELAKGRDEYDFSLVLQPLVDAAMPCAPAAMAFDRIKGGGGLDVLGAALADGLQECECAMDDLDGFVSLVMIVSYPYPNLAWVSVEFSGAKDATRLELDRTATYADFIAALDRLPVARRSEPIRYSTMK